MKRASNIFEHTDCVPEEMLVQYVSGKLSAAEKHEVEKHLIDCEMCSDAADGLKIIADKNKISKITSELNQKIQSRVGEKKEVKIIFLQQYRTQLALAASVVVLLGLVWFFRNTMSMKELDTATSEKIFADKFEPYPAAAEEEINNNAPVSESPALNRSESEVARKMNEPDEHPDNISAEDKRSGGKEITVTSQLSEADTKNEEGYSRAVVTEKKTAAPVTAAPQGDVVARDEVVLQDKAESTPKQAAPQKPAFASTSTTGTSAGAKDNSKKDKGDIDRELKEAEKQQQVELIALQTKSKSGKNRAKLKKSADDQPTPAQQQEVSGNIAVTESATLSKMDSVPSETVTVMDDTDLAMQKYEQKDYAGAAMDFETTLKKDPNNYNALFYSAVSYLSTGETDKAIIHLNKVLEKKDGELFDAAQWYLSLAYIKKNDTQNARKNLVELQKNPKSKYQKQADETLRDMQK